jgi:hypothetical protein
LRVVANAGDGRQRMVGWVAASSTHDQASGSVLC